MNKFSLKQQIRRLRQEIKELEKEIEAIDKDLTAYNNGEETEYLSTSVISFDYDGMEAMIGRLQDELKTKKLIYFTYLSTYYYNLAKKASNQERKTKLLEHSQLMFEITQKIALDKIL